MNQGPQQDSLETGLKKLQGGIQIEEETVTASCPEPGHPQPYIVKSGSRLHHKVPLALTVTEASSTVLEQSPNEARHTKALVSHGLRGLTWLLDKINRFPRTALLVLTLFYSVAVASLSSMKLLWLDEFITLHIARLSTVHAIWRALSTGADPNPPMTHVLVHYSRLFFGEHELALRLPAAVGYWAGSMALFYFLRRRVPVEWALAGVVMCMSMGAFDYSYESRSYGIFYGLAMIAFQCWCLYVAKDGSSSRDAALLGMLFALAAGVTTNYFAVLAFIPIIAGEVALTLRRSSELTSSTLTDRSGPFTLLWAGMDPRIWLTLLFASLPLLAFRSMIAHSIAQFAPHAWNKVSLDQVFDSYTEMIESILYPILGLLLLALMTTIFARLSAVCRTDVPVWVRSVASQSLSAPRVLPSHEAVPVFFLMAYPFLGYVMASLHGGMLSPRFVIPVCFGFGIAGVLAAYRLFGHFQFGGVILLVFCMAWFVARESVVGYAYMEQKQCFYKVIAHLPEAEQGLPTNTPIAIPDPLMALTFQYYAPAKYAARIMFPIDFAAIRIFRRDDSPEENLWAGRNSLYTLPIVPIAFFQHSAGRYLILASDGNWMLEDLALHHYVYRRLPINTRAGAIGGFTPLSHGVPAFFVSTGDNIFNGVVSPEAAPIPFTLSGNLPDETLSRR